MNRQATFWIFFLILLTACGAPQPSGSSSLLDSARQTMISSGQIPNGTSQPAKVFQPSEFPTLTLTFTPPPVFPSAESTDDDQLRASICVPQNNRVELGLVIDVIDSVTLLVSINGQEQPVRYIGLDPPADETFQSKAVEMNYALTINKVVMLIKDVSERDNNRALLRYVFVPDRNGAFLNYLMVRKGYAIASPKRPNFSCSNVLLQAEEQARYELEGLWEPTPIPTLTYMRPVHTSTPYTGNANCDPSYPTVCIAPPPPYFHCGNIPFRHFPVLPPDPHGFDSDGDGIGCEN